MTKEMIKSELDEKLEVFNQISATYSKYQKKYNKTDEYIEASLNELEKIIESLGALLEIYE